VFGPGVPEGDLAGIGAAEESGRGKRSQRGRRSDAGNKQMNMSGRVGKVSVDRLRSGKSSMISREEEREGKGDKGG
jgi:hypothetical protein